MSKNGEMNVNDALIISLGILSMPGDLLLFCENTAVRSSAVVNSLSKMPSFVLMSLYGSVLSFGSVWSPKRVLK